MAFSAYPSLRVALKSSASFRLPLAAACGLLMASPTFANPLGGAVSTGSASISASANKTNVNQKSEDVVINWTSFNIGSGQTTQFVQPNAQAIAVNRVGSANASQILGTLDANGRVVLINGNGVLFGKGARVNVGSLIATTTDGSDSDVLSGKFTQAGKQNASVVNNGAITAASGGLVALVAPNVTNTGTVNAKLGTVALGAANKFTVDFAGDGLVSFAAQGDVNARASAINTGSLSGANVSMTAHAANGIATGVVNMSGVILAQGVQNVGGTIYLDAGNGTLTTTGTLNAAGAIGGGQIETSGHAANISGTITAGKGGLWKVDPEDLTIDSNAATTIDGALNADTSVEEQTTSGAANGYGNQTSGAGDLTVASALSWNTNATLTLDAYHSLNILAPITISGAGGLVLQYNDAATDGVLSFGLTSSGFTGSVNYGSTNNGGTLAIDGTPYTLLYDMGNDATGVQGIDNNLNGNYALATPLDASGVGSWTPLGTDGSGNIQNGGKGFAGTFEGLGNTISNLTVDLPSVDYVGLFGYSSGTIRDLGMVAVSVSGSLQVGGLVDDSEGGTIANDYVTGTVDGTGDEVGGLVGRNIGGAIANSFSTATVTGASVVGGLAGFSNDGAITDSYSTGTVSGTSAVGGLVGVLADQGAITDSFATGAVGGAGNDVGGLVGLITGSGPRATITGSYATGAVTDTGSVSNVGGLVGEASRVTISNSFATGAVEGGSGSQNVGGFVGGEIGANLSIADSFSTGLVSGGNTDVGGFVGDDTSSGGITDSYWDMSTSGIGAMQGAGNVANDSGITGEATSALQGALPTGFSNTTWGTGAGLYPYLLWQYPSGTPQAVSGIAYSNGGGTVLQGGTVSTLLDGAALGTASTGANGYYYLLAAPGTITDSNNAVLAYSSANGARVDTATDALDTNNNVSGFDVWGNTLIAPTSDTTYSTASATSLQTQDASLIAQAVGANTDPTTGLTNYGYIATGFTIDEPLTLSNGLYVKTTGGNISVDDALTLPGSEGLALESSGALTIDAPINVTGAGAVALDAAYDTTTVPGNAVLELSFGSGDTIAYAVGSGEGISGQSLAINGAPYTLVYSATDLQNINNNLNGNYALANALDASSATSWVPLGVNGSGAIQNSLNGFNGNFEGLGNTISNFTLDLPGETYVGLFGYAGSASTIRDLGLAGGTITGTGSAEEGALVGEDYGIIANAQSNLAIDGVDGYLGGLAGYMQDNSSEIVNSSSSGTIAATGGANAGGLVGYSTGTIVSSYATGPVSAGADPDIGGLVGYANGAIQNSYATGNVSATSEANIGGLVGYAFGDISNSYATGNILATTGADAGGLAGFSFGTVIGSHATGSVSVGANADVGGLSGYADDLVENSYATGAVTAGGNSYTGGLTGFSSGEIENSYATGAASAGDSSHVGGLTGDSGGGILESYATGNASAGASSYVGGLAGDNGSSAIVKSYATGSATGGSNSDVGGLVGLNQVSIVEAYATGTVSGTSADVGGLVGVNGGTIAQTYATGYVAPGSGNTAGGLIGTDVASGGSVTFSYWDTGTTGITALSQGAGNVANDSGITGKTTANLQGALPNGFNNTVWGTGPGLYPYFLWQFPSGTPQAISGKVFSGSTALAGENVGLLIDGTAVTPAITEGSGANGYYYLLLAPGTISGSGSDVVTYLTSGTPANTFVQNATGTHGNVDLFENTFVAASNASDSAAILADIPAALGSASGPQFLYTASSGVMSGVNLVIVDTAPAFTLDSSLDVGNAILELYTTGSDTQTTGTITAHQLISVSTGGLSLGDANAIANLGTVGNSGAGGISVTDAQALTVAGNLSTGTGDIDLTTTGTGNGIAIDDHLVGGTVDLVSAGTIRENGTNGFIHASTLEGSSDGYAFFNKANKIDALGDFNTGGAGAFSLYNWATLDETGLLNTGRHSITLDTQIGDLEIGGALLGGTISLTSLAGEVDGAGIVDAHVLNVAADTGIDLDGSDNDIVTIGTDTTNSGPDVINQ